ncbi:uncharacterized protein F4822DRAFT_441060 [Hypoxylon trugodes]|uniref:uncharacterized protein n=1 Tax=Hypoxylon trugodes TaxID=326681 RepID=UPI00218F4E3E|nr:uncharacterized protein F4822DRAFT_441060 [Hypoxylon trugodes]KAI1391804.1 hypothetical protein F4822DRAFT_441060 [Hypoxylon trugodes]
MPSLMDLPVEVLAQIADIVNESSPKTTNSLSLVNHTFAELVRGNRFRILDFGRRAREEVIAHIDHHDLWKKIKHVKVKASSIHKYKFAFSEMTGLRDVELECHSVPTDLKYLLEVLRNQRNTSLHSISMKHKYGPIEGCQKMMRVLKELLLTCPNIRHLKLDIGMTNFGKPYHGLGFVDGERPPALETFDIVKYPFGTPDGWNPGYTLRCREQDYWDRCFDWSQLKRLFTSDPTMFSTSLQELTSLKEVDFKAIKVWDIYLLGSEGLRKHGSKLRILHVYELKGEYWSRNMSPRISLHSMDSKELSLTLDHCPNLEELSINLSGVERHLDVVLHTLARFPKLRSLSLYYTLSLSLPAYATLPFSLVTFSGVAKFFRELRDRSPGQPSPLRVLRVFSRWMPPMRYCPDDDDISDRKVSFVCELSERDDEVAKGVFSVTCLEVTEEENTVMRGALERGCPTNSAGELWNGKGPEMYSTKFKRAWYRPMSDEAWMAYSSTGPTQYPPRIWEIYGGAMDAGGNNRTSDGPTGG